MYNRYNDILCDDMETKAKRLVLDKYDYAPEVEIYIVWKCKILQNWKFLISTNIPDGKYFEVTYNGELRCWYLDEYIRNTNQIFNDEMEEVKENEE